MVPLVYCTIILKMIGRQTSINLFVCSLLAFFCLIVASHSISVPLTVGPSEKYVQAKSVTFNTGPYYPSGSSTLNTIYTFTHHRPMSTPYYKFIYSLEKIQAEFSSRYFDYYLFLDSKYTTESKVRLTSYSINQISLLRHRIMLIEQDWGHFSAFWRALTYGGVSLSNSSPIVETITSVPAINMTGTVLIYHTIIGFDVRCGSSNQLSILIDVVRTTATQLTVTISTLSTSLITLYRIVYNEVSINLGQIEDMPGKITFGTFSATNNYATALSYIDNTNITRDVNTIVGVRGFHLNNQAFFSWDVVITPEISITVSSSNNFLYFEFSYMIIQQNWCGDSTPYLKVSTSTCYDVCPVREWGKDLSLTCQPCLYDCYECQSGTSCSSCNETTDFRTMNNATDRCEPITGYYESGVTQATQCKANCTSCTSFTFCTGCVLGFSLVSANCIQCSSNCSTCTSTTACTACFTPYSISGTICVLNCSLSLGNCTTCVENAGQIDCTICDLGFFLDPVNKNCSIICGDGILASVQECDDNNTIDGDGCDSFCTIEPAYYCNSSVGATSSCDSCEANCLNCSSVQTCSLCDTLFVLNGSSCTADCSYVDSCATCQVSNGSVECLSCNIGYSLNGSRLCETICGDGLILGSEECDDNNTGDGDGCDHICRVEQKYFCESQPSACYPCLQYCLECVENTSCTICNNLTIWDSGTVECQGNCSIISNCSTCTVGQSSAGDYVECLSCSGGYSVDSSINKCRPICGDGILAPEETCEDGNLENEDGCDSSCSVQAYFKCNTSLTTSISQCFLTHFNLTLSTLIKNQGQNSGTMIYKPEPERLKIYQNIDWASVVEITSPYDMKIKNVYYNKENDRVVVDFNYSSTIRPNQNISLKMNTENDDSLSDLEPFYKSEPAITTNNLALVYYKDSHYTLANIAKYVAIFLGATSVFFTFAGLFGGRLIGLECSGVIQLAFLCLLTLEDLSPTLDSLGMLHYSFGYNSLQSYDSTQNIDRPFIAEKFSSKFILNFNIMAALVVAPILCSLVCRLIASRCSQKEEKEKWLRRFRLLIGEYSFYLFLSFAYLAYLSLLVQVKYLGNSLFDYVGIGEGALFLVAGVCLAVLYIRSENFFTQFKKKFRKEVAFGNRFYIFFMIQRLVSPTSLVILSSKFYGNAPITAIYLALLVLLLTVRPYKGARKNFRPVANSIVVIIVSGIFFAIAFMNDPQSIVALYGPFAVMALLFICVIYSAYALVNELKQKYCEPNLENEDINKTFEQQMTSYNANNMYRNYPSLIVASCRPISLKSDQSPDEDCLDSMDSPNNKNRELVKQKLSQMKKTHQFSTRKYSDGGPIRKQSGLSDILNGFNLEEI